MSLKTIGNGIHERMNRYVADTMALVLRLEHRRLPTLVKETFIESEKGRAKLLILTMVLSEVAYLSEKRRIDISLVEVEQYIRNNSLINEYPLTLQTIKVAFDIDDIPELHDRLMAASAKEANAVLITNDPVIENSSHVKALWKK